MRAIHLNLAARPYRDYRAVYSVAAGIGLVALLLTIINVMTAYRYLVNTKETRAEIARIDTEKRAEEKRAEQLRTELSRVDLTDLNAQTRFINSQIADRAFSWSALLDNLERVVPPDVRVEKLNPTIDKSGLVHLGMDCASKAPDGMVRMLNQLLRDPHFESAFPQSEQQQDALRLFRLSVDYRPKAIIE